MLKTMVCVLGGLLAATAAAETAQEVIRKAYQAESYKPFATPQLRSIMTQGDRAARKADPDMACEMFEHYHLGLGNGDMPEGWMKKLHIKQIKPNVYRASYKDRYYGFQTDFTMQCRNGKCLIDDVGDVKKYYRQIIRSRSCGY